MRKSEGIFYHSWRHKFFVDGLNARLGKQRQVLACVGQQGAELVHAFLGKKSGCEKAVGHNFFGGMTRSEHELSVHLRVGLGAYRKQRTIFGVGVFGGGVFQTGQCPTAAGHDRQRFRLHANRSELAQNMSNFHCKTIYNLKINVCL